LILTGRDHGRGSTAWTVDPRDPMRTEIIIKLKGTVDSVHCFDKQAKRCVVVEGIHDEPGVFKASDLGYLWWIDTFRGHEAFIARGAQGQMIYVFPGLEMVIVTTGNLPAATFVQSLDQLVRSYILPAAD